MERTQQTDSDRALEEVAGAARIVPSEVLDEVAAIAHRADQSRSLDPFYCREPGRYAVVVVCRLNPVRFDGGDIPSIAGVERRSQLFLTDGVRASIRTIVTEAQHIQGSIVLGHRR